MLFDVGHGSGSFSFSQAVPAVAQGFVPDSLGTDLHTSSMIGGMKDMANLLSKFLNMGMSLPDVVLRSTWKPAEIINRPDLGHLSEGAVADVAVFRLVEGNLGFLDARLRRMSGSRKLECELTLRDGRVVWDLNGLAGRAWEGPSEDR